MPFFATKSNHAALKQLFSVHLFCLKVKTQKTTVHLTVFIQKYFNRILFISSFMWNKSIYSRLQNVFCICLVFCVFCGGTGVFSHLLHHFSECWYASFHLFISYLEQTLAQTLAQKKRKTALLIFSCYWLLQGSTDKAGKWLNWWNTWGNTWGDSCNIKCWGHRDFSKAWDEHTHRFRLQFLITMKGLSTVSTVAFFFF